MSFSCGRSGAHRLRTAGFSVAAVAAVASACWLPGSAAATAGTEGSGRLTALASSPSSSGSSSSRAPGASPASAQGRPALSLLAQSEWVEPPRTGGPASFSLALAAPSAPSGSQVSAALYPRLRTRSAFEHALRAGPSGLAVSRTHPVDLSSLPAASGGGVELGVAVVTSSSHRVPAGTPSLDLSCATATCTGVYPVVVELSDPSGSGDRTPSTFTTFLTYTQAKSADQLRFSWVVPVDGAVSVDRSAPSLGASRPSVTSAVAGSLAQLVAELKAAAVPVTVEPVPQTLQALEAGGAAGRAALASLVAMSADPAVFQLPAQPYAPANLASLAAAGEGTEIQGQMAAGAALFQSLGIVATPDPRSWVATGAVGQAIGPALSEIGASQAVVPESALAPAGTGLTSTWASTFDLPVGKATDRTTVVAAAADPTLAAHFADASGDPALAAAQLLADLAMIHFERPYTPTPRGVVAVPPSDWVPRSRFVRALLEGLQKNPLVKPVTLSQLFVTVPLAGSRRLQSDGPGPALPAGLAHQVSVARLELTAFDSAVRSPTPVLSRLDQLLLASESDHLSRPAKHALVATFGRLLRDQLHLVRFVTGHTITLTARTGWIPLTVVSGAPYTVVGKLTVSGAKFEFPHRSSHSLVLDHATNPVRIDVVARTSGDLPLQAVFTTPEGDLTIAQGQLTVRSTATSVVGIALTALALAVLLTWWARTWLSGRRRRRAAQSRRAGP